MPSITDQMIHLYVFVDDFLKANPHYASWRRSPNNAPIFSDAEVVTVALMQGCFQVATLKQTYRLVADNFRTAFPHLPSYPQWLARFHALAPLVGRLIQHALPAALIDDGLYIMDSKPIPTCKPIRHGRVRLLRECDCYARTGRVLAKERRDGSSASNSMLWFTDEAARFYVRFSPLPTYQTKILLLRLPSLSMVVSRSLTVPTKQATCQVGWLRKKTWYLLRLKTAGKDTVR